MSLNGERMIIFQICHFGLLFVCSLHPMMPVVDTIHITRFVMCLCLFQLTPTLASTMDLNVGKYEQLIVRLSHRVNLDLPVLPILSKYEKGQGQQFMEVLEHVRQYLFV